MYAPKINAPITNKAMRTNIVFCRLSIFSLSFYRSVFHVARHRDFNTGIIANGKYIVAAFHNLYRLIDASILPPHGIEQTIRSNQAKVHACRPRGIVRFNGHTISVLSILCIFYFVQKNNSYNNHCANSRHL